MTPLLLLLLALGLVIAGVLVLRFPPFVVLITAALVVATLTPPATVARQLAGAGDVADASAVPSASQRVATGFGKTAGNVGIVIAMASILGACLTAAGAAERLVAAIQRLVGPENTPLALLLAGFVLGVPMFADTVFFLLLPLAQAASARTGRHQLLNVMAIVAGVTMTHSLVPPTPGPLFVAETLQVDLAAMIGVGAVVGLVAAAAGFGYAWWADRRWQLVPAGREIAATAGATGTHPAAAGNEPLRSASLGLAMLPLLLPVGLISLHSIAQSAPDLLPAAAAPLVEFLGDKNIALVLAAAAAVAVLATTGAGLPQIRTTLAEATLEAGGVLLVIAAGGALGLALRQAGMAELAGGLSAGSGLWLIPAAWLITVVVRTAQGSATVAMITAAGVVGPILLEGTSGCDPVYVAVAIGCGSKPGMWMNDSGFWVIARMSGLTERQMLATVSTMLSVEGTVGLLVTLLLAAVW